jgi:hypothetical protein
VDQTKPQFGIDYDIGWVGFTNVGGVASDIIGWVEQRYSHGPIARVTHTFIVSGEDEIIEAHLTSGVAIAKLSKYLDPYFKLYFRKPFGWTPILGNSIAIAAYANVGDTYDTALIISQVLAKTLTGYWLNKLFKGAPDRWVSRHLDAKKGFICSELVADAMSRQPELALRGVLQDPINTIDPQELFEDDVLFEK